MKRKYWIISTNCDCASDKIARVANTHWLYGPRCPCCNKVLGCMQWMVIGDVKANNSSEALHIYYEERRNDSKKLKEETQKKLVKIMKKELKCK